MSFWLFCYLDKVRDYFGENVAFYFAFLEFYTKALIPTSILGEKKNNKPSEFSRARTRELRVRVLKKHGPAASY